MLSVDIWSVSIRKRHGESSVQLDGRVEDKSTFAVPGILL